ncbi:O-antigen ligase family protein [Aromatoleum diolicum]|uniref:O-antigen ligase-related domain-containing protein n=1 Tax=Aromatoleum diolicum TaxID=75796 RepID=A0ABX1QGM5_9RHOO|nr:O-antigen ligase family protein [Aromatoleum diolicum]NMG76662.1 hypothetical protein [Aromatoleum diolicum]
MQQAIGWQMPLIAIVMAMAFITGLAIPNLTVDSLADLLISVCGLGAAVAFGVIVYFAARARPKAIFAFLTISAFLVDATFRQREMAAQGIDGQTLLKLIIWICWLVVAVISTRNCVSIAFQGDIKWLSIFSLLALGSTLYSLTPAYTFGAGVAAIAYCALAVCVVNRLSRIQILYGLLLGLCIPLMISVLMFSVGAGLARMEGGTVFRLGGVLGSPNALGRSAALAILIVGVLVFSYKISVHNWRVLGPLSIALVCLFLSDSRTSVLAVFAAFGLHVLRGHVVVAFCGFILVTILALVFLNADFGWERLGAALSRTGRLSEITTLTGRTDIWAASWAAFIERPILGYGFGATKVLLPEVFRTYWGFTVTQAHNFLLQTLVTTGLAGFAFVLIAIARQVVAYIKKPTMFQTVILGYILVQGLTEAGPVGPAPNIVTLFWALSLCWDRGRDEPDSMHFSAMEHR